MAAVLACGTWRRPQPPRGRGPPRPPTNRQRPGQRHGDRRGTTLPGIRCHWARALGLAATHHVDGIPVTTLARTYLDLAEVLNHRRLLEALEAGQRQNKLDVGALEAVIARNPGRRGIKPLQAAGRRARPTSRPPPVTSGAGVSRAHPRPRPSRAAVQRLRRGRAGGRGVARAPAGRRGRRLELPPQQAVLRRTTAGATATLLRAPRWRVVRFTADDVDAARGRRRGAQRAAARDGPWPPPAR